MKAEVVHNNGGPSVVVDMDILPPVGAELVWTDNYSGIVQQLQWRIEAATPDLDAAEAAKVMI